MPYSFFDFQEQNQNVQIYIIDIFLHHFYNLILFGRLWELIVQENIQSVKNSRRKAFKSLKIKHKNVQYCL